MVNITLRETRQGSVTDKEGAFTITRVPLGVYTIEIRHIGYQEKIYQEIHLKSDTDVNLTVRLTPVAIQLKEVTVSPGSFSFMGAGSSSRQTMSREDIESVPQFGEDIFRAVNRLPGLSSGDYSAHFSIRGGRHDETLILLDGLEIYEPYHLKDFNEGAISIIDVETIGGVELMTGGFPAEYGNKLSGVFNITSRKPEEDHTRYSVGMSFMNARAMLEGTFAQGKGSWVFSARRGYLDLVFNLMNQNDLPSPMYYDLFSKMDYQIHPNHLFSANVLHARDKYTYNAKATTGFQDTLKTQELANNKYGNSYAWVRLKSTLGRKVSVQNMASVGTVTKSRDGTEKYTDFQDVVYELTNKRDFHILGFKQDWSYEYSNAVFLEAGLDIKKSKVDDTFHNIVGKNPDDPSTDSLAYYPIETRTAFKTDGTTLGLYLVNRFQLLDPLTLELGLRYDRTSYTKDSDFSPRVNALVKLAQRTNLRLAWGHYRQVQGIEDVAALNGQSGYFPSELSRQWTVGLDQSFPNGARVRVEGYYKKGSNLRPKYRNWKGSPDVFLETNEDRILVFPDKTTSRGIELYYDQNFGKKVSLRGSYALSQVEEQTNRIDNINNPSALQYDSNHLGPQDQRHALNLDSTYRPSHAWSLNLSYAFHSGWPGTLENMLQVIGDDGETDFSIQPVKLYGSKLPDYHRLDARITRKFETSRGEVRFFLEVVNLTNHNNVFGYDFYRVLNTNGELQL
ncbi:MAG: TonB-dependent receptor, partial [bacterium]|nr:TonB-dependent receptor [bacterium]